jgi:localization factor PodJL
MDARPEPLHSPINSDLPPDHPLEPGTQPPGRALSPSERIAASEDAISELSPATSPEPVSTSSFIAAARRAAQAAANAPATAKPSRAATLNESIRAAAKGSPITSKIRSLLVGASVVVIVLGSFRMAMTLLDGSSSTAPKPVAERSAPLTPPPANDRKSEIAPAAPPSMTSPTPIDRQTLNAPPANIGTADSDAANDVPPSAAGTATPDVTGSIPAQRNSDATLPPTATSGATVQIPASEKLPESIGGATLRSAALKGDPAAAYEVATRFAEGKGVTANLDEAAKWYDRAAQGGIVPAIFRVGTLYEKGISVKKDVDTARRYYLMAAERGSAKAMHNLAVLDADGGGKGADYRSASQWFRNAAERGVADSQFNLGILYARGIGVEQNFAESFKWFSHAAAQGDSDAGRKRDDVAKRLDAQSLATAKLAVQNFAPVKQPDDAVNVASPAGGWDAPLAKTTSAKLPRTARAAH